MTQLGIELASGLAEATLRKTAETGLANARLNLPYITRTIFDLDVPKPTSAIVFGAGPSLHRRNPAAVLRDAGYSGSVVASDAALGFCLRNGLVPDFVVTVDSHPHRIIRWFGDPDLATRPEDDYYRRQELDPIHHEDEIRANAQMIGLLNEHGPKIKAVIATSIDPGITRRCLDAGMELYWWNPLYDDYDDPNSYSRRVHTLTGVPCMVTGGNVGASAYVFATAVLGAPDVALVGFDLGYAAGTTPYHTQYYHELHALLGDRTGEAFIDVHNPDTGETSITDPTYYWYRKVFLEVAAVAPCRTYNCTEGGTLFGEHITTATLASFLAAHPAGGVK